MKPFALDIETVPNMDILPYLPDPEVKYGNTTDAKKRREKEFEAKKKQIIKMALNPFYSRVACYCIVGDDRETEEILSIENRVDEVVLVDTLLADIRDCTKKGSMIVTWNGYNFDLPFIYKRAIILGLEIPLGCPPLSKLNRRYSRAPHCDLMQEMVGWQGGQYLKLDEAAQFILGERKTEDFDVTQILPIIEAGQGKKVLDYCRQDTALTLKLFNKVQPFYFEKGEKQ